MNRVLSAIAATRRPALGVNLRKSQLGAMAPAQIPEINRQEGPFIENIAGNAVGGILGPKIDNAWRQFMRNTLTGDKQYYTE